MKNIRFALCFIAVFTFLGACASSQSHANATVAGVEFRLTDNSGKCRFVYEPGGKTVDLQISWPCHVHRAPDGEIRVLKIRGRDYILIENSRPHPELLGDCITELQAIRFSNIGIHPSEYMDKVGSCPPFQWDGKVFTGLFEDE